MNYKTITQTYVFSQLQDTILKTIQDTLSKSDILSKEELEEQFVLIKKYVKSALKIKVLKDFDDKNVRLLYAPDNINKISSLPFIMSVEGGNIIANVIVSSFGSRRQDGVVNVDYRKLYTLMESAFIAKRFLTNYNKYRNNSILVNASSLYANMFVKPLNKKFNVHLDRNRENTIMFLASKFYLKNVLGLQNEEIIFNISMKACKTPNPLMLKEADIALDDDAFKNLGTFLDALKEDKLNIGLKGLTGRGYLETYISLYSGSTVFGLELMPYWLYIVNASISSMGLVNNFALEDIMEKSGAKVIAQFLN